MNDDMDNQTTATISNQSKLGYILIFLAGTSWGTVGFFVTLLHNLGFNAYQIAFTRIGFGSVFLIPVIILFFGKKGFLINKEGLLFAFIMGIFTQALFNITYNQSISSVGVATASILLYTAPIFVCIMSKIVFKEIIGKVKLIALTINIIGCILTVTNGNFSAIQSSLFGILMGICAGFLYASMTILGKIASKKGHNTVIITFYSFIFGAIFLLFIIQPWNMSTDIISNKSMIISIGFGLIPAALSYFLYMKGLSKPIETSKAPVIASVETVVAAIIGVIIFNEIFGIYKAVGIVLVLISIVLVNLERKSIVNSDSENPET